MRPRRHILPLMVLAALSFAPWRGIAADRSLDPRAVEGVYKERFKNGNVEGDTYVSEDVLEIVRVAPDAAYVRAHLDFYNGHICAISGVARVEGRELVYRTPATQAEGKPGECALHLFSEAGALRLEDHFSCRDYCGARGMFGGAKFRTGGRRPIRYMARLKASREFAEAMAAYARTSP